MNSPVLTGKLTDPRWISVKDRLPEEGQRVIGHVPELYAHGITIVQREGRASDPSVVLWTYEAEWVSSEGWHSYVDVTHWMPLPDWPSQREVRD